MGEPVGTPVTKGPWPVGTWVWHARNRLGPWVVIHDDGGDLVYVDTDPVDPASCWDSSKAGQHYKRITLNDSNVRHHYRSMLVDIEPPPWPREPHWSEKVNWDRIGKSVGFGLGVIVVGLMGLFIFWLELGAPH